jgi:hypothetical protein
MNSLPTLNFPTGKIGFASTVRGWDEEPRDAFRVELPDRPTMFGEWRAKFADNGNDFNVEIVSFGYLRESHLGSAHLLHRKEFFAPERDVVERLIRALFADESPKTGAALFATKKARFLGAVNFMPGWILRGDE